MDELKPKTARRRRPRKLERRSTGSVPAVQTIQEERKNLEHSFQENRESTSTKPVIEQSFPLEQDEILSEQPSNVGEPDETIIIETPVATKLDNGALLSTNSSRTPSARGKRRRRPKKLMLRSAPPTQGVGDCSQQLIEEFTGDVEDETIDIQMPFSTELSPLTEARNTMSNNQIIQRVSILEEKVQQMSYQLESTTIDVREMKTTWLSSRTESVETSTSTSMAQEPVQGQPQTADRYNKRSVHMPVQTVRQTGILSESASDDSESEEESDIETIIIPSQSLRSRPMTVRNKPLTITVQPSQPSQPSVREISAAFRSNTTVRTSTEVRTSSSSGAMRMRDSNTSENWSQVAGSALGGMFMAQASRIIEGTLSVVASGPGNERPAGSGRRASSRKGRPYDVSDL